MSILDMFFARKRRMLAAVGIGTSAARPDRLLGLAAQGSRVMIAPEGFDAVLPSPEQLTDAGGAREPRDAVADLAIFRRVTALTLGRDASAEARQAAVLERLAIVHDPNEVVIAAEGRFARLAIADRRLMSARFGQPGMAEQSFDFRHDTASEDAAIDCVRALAALCAEPVDLVIVEQPISGVFASAGGFAVGDISFDEELCRDALQRAMQLPDADESEYDDEDLAFEVPEAAVMTEDHQVAVVPQLLYLTPQDIQHAFAEDAEDFVGAAGAGRSD